MFALKNPGFQTRETKKLLVSLLKFTIPANITVALDSFFVNSNKCISGVSAISSCRQAFDNRLTMGSSAFSPTCENVCDMHPISVALGAIPFSDSKVE